MRHHVTSCDREWKWVRSGWRKMSFDRRRCGREPRWRERKRKRKTGGSRKRKGFPLQVPAGIEEKGCLLHGGVDVVVVGKLRQGEECVPVILSFSDEEPQVLFQFLVDPFRWSVGLRSKR